MKLRIILTLVACAATPFPALIRANDVTVDGSQPQIIRAKQLFLGTGEVLSPGDVLIENGRIAQVAASIEMAGARVVSVESLIPGLVDAYTQTGLRGQDAERTRELTPHLQTVSIVDWTDREFQEQRAAGTTTLNIVPGTNNVIAGQACIVKTAGDARERIVRQSSGVFVSVCRDPASGNGARSRPDSIYIRQPTNRMGVIWLLRNAFHVAASKPESASVLNDVLQNDRVVFGVSRTHHDIEALLSIADEFKFQPVLVGGQEAWRVLDELSKRQVSVVLERTVPGSADGSERTRICAELAKRLHERGVLFCLSEGDLLNQARFAVGFGLSKDTALQAITSAPSKILKIDDRVGTIAVGKDADLVALNGEPMQFTSAVEWVMVDGVMQPEQDQN